MLGTLRIARARAAVAEASAALADLSESVHAVGNTELEVFFGEVDELSRQLEAARVAILGQALSRGVVAESDAANATAWVIHCAPSYRAGGAAQLVRVTRATAAVRNTGLGAAVLGARVGIRNAAVALTEMDKLRPRLRDEAVATVWAGFLQIATDHGPDQIHELRDKLIATYGHDGGVPTPPGPAQVRVNAKTCPLVEDAVDLVLGRLRAGAHDHPVDVDVMRPGRDPRHTVSNVL